MVREVANELILSVLEDLLGVVLRISRDLSIVEIVVVEGRAWLTLVRVEPVF